MAVASGAVWILLPPSETKAPGGGGAPLALPDLHFPELGAHRTELAERLAALCADVPAARTALAVTAAADEAIAANTVLHTAPTMPALSRYRGVLFDALDAPSLSGPGRRRLAARVLIASALFGAVAATDLIPAYRLSAGSRLPGLGTLPRFWRPSLTAALASLPGPVLDLRSGAYAGLAPLPEAMTARVVTIGPDGARRAVSHHNKAAKGLLARAIGTAATPPTDAESVVAIARAAGIAATPVDGRTIEVLV